MLLAIVAIYKYNICKIYNINIIVFCNSDRNTKYKFELDNGGTQTQQLVRRVINVI